MNSLVINSYAKLNLYLKVLGKRKDSYHNLETIFERISLYDKITLTLRCDREIRIISSCPDIPKDNSNLAYKSAELLQESFCSDKGVDIKIIKRIPVGSGMGGGSSNAASVLIGLNKLWRLNLDQKKLTCYARKLGADVPFFIYNTPFALGTGRGDKIKPLNRLNSLKFWHILVVPKIKVPTQLIYQKLDEADALGNTIETLTIRKFNVKLLTSALLRKDFSLINGNLFNSLEEITVGLFPEIKRIKEKFIRLGLKSSLMSGSGSTVFGFVYSRKEALSLSKRLEKNKFWHVFVTYTL